LRAEPLRLTGEGIRDRVERVVPPDPLEAARAPWPHAAQRVGQAVLRVHALGVAADLLANPPAGVGVAVGAAHAADGARVDALDLQRAGAGAVVRAHRRNYLHGLEDTPGCVLLHCRP